MFSFYSVRQSWRNQVLLMHLHRMSWVQPNGRSFWRKPVSACIRVESLSPVRFFSTPWMVACQAPLSMGFFRQECQRCVAISSSKGSSWPRDRTCISSVPCIAGGFFISWAIGGFSLCLGWLNVSRTPVLHFWRGIPKVPETCLTSLTSTWD